MESKQARALRIREITTQFLDEVGESQPPLSPDSCLSARRLRLADEPLDRLLDGIDPGRPGLRKVNAMLDVSGREIWLRDGLHPNQQRFGKMHEVGHFVIPWHRGLLYTCTIFDLPRAIQEECELDANQFAAESFFFGERFIVEATSNPFNLFTAKRLAEQYRCSYEATFRHYAENHNRPCCLLVSQLVPHVGGISSTGQPEDFEIRYFVRSPTFPDRITVKQRFSYISVNDGSTAPTYDQVITHELRLPFTGGGIVYHAQSLTTSYKIFTLISPRAFD